MERSGWYELLWGALCFVTVSLSVCERRFLHTVAFKNVTADFISANGFYQASNTEGEKRQLFLSLRKLVGAEAGKK